MRKGGISTYGIISLWGGGGVDIPTGALRCFVVLVFEVRIFIVWRLATASGDKHMPRINNLLPPHPRSGRLGWIGIAKFLGFRLRSFFFFLSSRGRGKYMG